MRVFLTWGEETRGKGGCIILRHLWEQETLPGRFKAEIPSFAAEKTKCYNLINEMKFLYGAVKKGVFVFPWSVRGS